jgi:hypothetical protein
MKMVFTPCLDPKYAPTADRGAEIPNHIRTINNIVPGYSSERFANPEKDTYRKVQHQRIRLQEEID